MRNYLAFALIALTLAGGVAALATFATRPASAGDCPNSNC